MMMMDGYMKSFVYVIKSQFHQAINQLNYKQECDVCLNVLYLTVFTMY